MRQRIAILFIEKFRNMQTKSKLPFINFKLLNKQNFNSLIKVKSITKTWSRSSTILPCLIKKCFTIYNGQKHIPICFSEQMIGHKFGEFALTKTFFSHKKTDKKIQHLKF